MNEKRRVVITADSTCDLSDDLRAKYDVKLMPMHVILDDKSYRDGIDIFLEDIYKTYNEKKILPKTAAISVGDYADSFKQFVDEGFEVVHFSLSSDLSSTHMNAKIASQDFEGVEVVDTKRLSTGSGLLIIKGAELADKGLSANEIFNTVSPMADKVDTSFVLDNLEYMRHGGRCSTIAMLGANLLKIKPSIFMPEGKLILGKKYRGNLKSVLIQYIADRLEGKDDLDLSRIFITHTTMDDPTIIPAVEEQIKQFADFDEILVTVASTTIACHCGKNTLGILFMTK